MSRTSTPTCSPADSLTSRTITPPRAAVALVVGIGDYLHGEQIDPLRFATADAQAVADTLADPNVGAFPPERVALLTDQQARRDDLVSRLSNWLPAQAAGAELVLIYFAGHGAVKKIGRHKDGYLLPHDADPNDLVTRGVAMRDVARWIEAIQAKAVVVCLDCCHAGKILRQAGGTRSNARHLALSPAAFRPLEGQGRILIASCHEGQVSFESTQLSHGLFTHHLLEGMAGKADRDGDGKVGVNELFEYVAAAVREDSMKQFGAAQEPWKSGTEAGGVYLTAPRGGCRLDADRSTLGRWTGAEGTTAVSEVEQLASTAGPDQLLERLRQLERHADPAAVPVVFRCLAHADEAVRRQAARVRDAIGWGRVVTAAEDLARRGQDERLGHVLDGLNAIEAHPEVVNLLERLVGLLGGDLLVRAGQSLRAKQLSLGQGEVAALFERIRSQYRIEDVLGAGRLTAAYLARDESTGLRVVVRVLLQEFTYQPQVVAQFRALGRKAVPCVHHNLVITREARDFPEHRIYYTVRDYIDGVTLQRALRDKRYEPLQIVKILHELLDALTVMHQEGCTHGGVTPSNIFLRSADQRVVLGDPAPHLAGLPLVPERLLYDFRYASPEVFPGAGTPLPQSDLYAVGCVAHELCCGVPPFVSDNFFELGNLHAQQPVPRPSGRGSPLGLAGDALLLRLLAKSPAGRFASARDALDALKRVESSLESPDRTDGGAIDLVGQASLARYQDVQSLVGFNPLSAPASAAPPPEPAGPAPSSAAEESAPPTTIAPSPGAAPPASVLPRADFPDDMCSTMAGPLPGGLPPHTPPELPDASARADSPGDVPGGYRLLRLLGRGAYSEVWRAEAPGGVEVAIKLIPRALGSGESHRELEALQLIKRLRHPFLLSLQSFYALDDRLIIVLELAEQSLRQRLQECQRIGWPGIPLAELLRYIEEAAGALDYLHTNGVQHRDIKPDNLLLVGQHVKVADCGLARLLEGNLTRSSSTIGTPAYMAPEIWQGKINPHSDQYSLAATYGELRVGRSLFPVESLAQLVNWHLHGQPDLTGFGERERLVLEQALAKSPEARFPSCTQFAQALARAVGEDAGQQPFPDGPPKAHRPRLGKRLLGWVRRRPVGAVLAGAGTLAALVGLAFWAGLW